ncbi:ADP-ribosylglycohydrolase family protein [Weissella diestrammenae]|uniref:ADP-ribosylglycohydrolase family protein n=1 Tax=Weissella diestrammenae TaxID=1162633 RepID=A0A7G9T5U8_9LACO|nr:ADP-ribosylglycohydrolase family protein [Weissella diestrammenae]MCM0582303.1 ADP-ribosylglycohydrolase family protein [Weissella diestrammenae]QNN75473.1 ADP-ribosylglycohydrolase family protein [Weissella diestrammenae]
MDLPNNPLINSTLGLLDGDLKSQQDHTEGTQVWGSDSSLTLATINALSNGYNLIDIMNEFEKWYAEGKYTANGQIQTIGKTTQGAILRFSENHDPFSSGGIAEDDNGSGALTRMMPVILYLYSQYGSDFINNETAMLTLHQIAGLTHNHPRGLVGIGLYAILIGQILDGFDLEMALDRAVGLAYEYYSEHDIFAEALSEFENLNTPDFVNKPMKELKATGYIVDTLEVITWVLLNTDSYDAAMKLTVEIPGKSHAILPLVGTVAAIIYQQHDYPSDIVTHDMQTELETLLNKAVLSGKFAIYS